jgi:hypothetical protein
MPRWVASQNGFVRDFRQPQSATVCRFVIVNGIGFADPPSCVPSQNG